MMKKVGIVLSILIVVLSLNTDNVYAASKARTLRELRSELSALKAEKRKNESNKKATKNEISSAKNSVSSKQAEISANQNKIASATKESQELEKEIRDGKDELERLINAYQVAQGDNVYLEYIFEATSYEDLIYRYAIIEEIMSYQEEQIESHF